MRQTRRLLRAGAAAVLGLASACVAADIRGAGHMQGLQPGTTTSSSEPGPLVQLDDREREGSCPAWTSCESCTAGGCVWCGRSATCAESASDNCRDGETKEGECPSLGKLWWAFLLMVPIAAMYAIMLTYVCCGIKLCSSLLGSGPDDEDEDESDDEDASLASEPLDKRLLAEDALDSAVVATQ